MTANALLHWLQRTTLEASVLILAVLALRLVLGTRLSPAWRMGLWMLVGIKLLIPAFLSAGFGLGSLWNAPRDINDRSDTLLVSQPSVNSVSSVVETRPSSTATAPHPSSFPLPHSILALWLPGAVGVLATALLRQRRFHQQLARLPLADDPHLSSLLAQLASLAQVPTPQVLLSAPGTTPALVGIRRPSILLPNDWQTRFDTRSLRHILLHELLHVRHRDLLWNWAGTAVQALHWFNPLVRFVADRFQADRELRCDAGAIALLAPSERLDYGHTLLRIQETFFAPPAIAGLAPCVRHHPALRQRILMIAQPTPRQPWLHALLVLTLSVLAGYSFTTARAAEKEVPPKIREGTTTKPSTESVRKPAMKDGEREGGSKPSAEREGQRKPNAERDSEKKPGMRDGDRPRNGPRDGEKPRTGPRDGEGRKPSAESGQKPRQGDANRSPDSTGELITLQVIDGGDTVLIGDEKIPMNRLRGFLSTFLPDHPGAQVLISEGSDTPVKSLHQILDAVRDNGNKSARIQMN